MPGWLSPSLATNVSGRIAAAVAVNKAANKVANKVARNRRCGRPCLKDLSDGLFEARDVMQSEFTGLVGIPVGHRLEEVHVFRDVAAH